MSAASSCRLVLALAVQNLGRRQSRTLLLVAAIAVASAVTFGGVVAMRSVVASMQIGLSRVGADLMVVNQAALTNLTDALLTVEPTDSTLPADALARADVAGIARLAAQRILRTDQSGLGGAGELVDLIGFDPATDFTILPWLSERLTGPMQPGDVILGAARNLPLGTQVVLFGQPFRVYGKLARTGSGTQERGVFLHMASLIGLGDDVQARTGAVPPMLEPANVTGFLVQLAPGVSELQLRFALLSNVAGIKVIVGGSLLTGIRQGLVALLGGLVLLVVALSASTAVMVMVLFSAIMAERRREMGLLKAIGARPGQIVAIAVAEAAFATAAGGALGVVLGLLLLRLFERALVHHLSEMGIPFLWLDGAGTAAIAALCVAGAALVGMAGAWFPAWRMGRRDTHDLLWKEG
ncbi:putative ABC transport system permease protein [Ancylobacter aquaticus]|uniref:Putative ABC transport system permease protein n=1 Tax=Ancylobacter aquaticus TaxID=100 RepID=A0A4R1I475_ANCAQ|nr:FtsX-like permease family protein [Ancylobacter aquaticus]TCK28160.1 putative ABC transport system permease protein [Ancylobacter aquaticus]